MGKVALINIQAEDDDEDVDELFLLYDWPKKGINPNFQ